MTSGVTGEALSGALENATKTAAVATVVGTAASALYNFGFFWTFDGSLISLLNIQDLLVGGMAGTVSVVLLLAFCAVISFAITRLMPKHGSERLEWFVSAFHSAVTSRSLLRWVLKAVAVLWLMSLGVLLLFLHITIGYFGSGMNSVVAIVFAMVLTLATMFCFNANRALLAGITFAFLCIIAVDLGLAQASDLTRLDLVPDTVVQFRDKSADRVLPVIRISASYIFGYENNQLIVIPWDTVSGIGPVRK